MTDSGDHQAAGNDRVVVIGAGLVGASIGCALVRTGHQVHLEDRVPSHAIVAAGRGAGVITPAPAREVTHVVVAVPPDAVAATVIDALARFPQAVVTDVASVKAAIIAALEHAAVDASRYCGSHPMAGSQLSGPLTANADLFVDRTWVVTPHRASTQASIDAVAELAEICGARTITMPADQHDRAVAQVSHLPQLMSTLTAGHLRVVPRDHLQLAGQGIRDVTRIAGSDPGLWRQIIGANTDAVRTELEGVRADLDELLRVLDDPGALEGFMSRGRDGVRTLPGKHGLAPAETVRVVIEIPDAPGSLARLFSDVESAGVNVEDLQIEHDPSRRVGFLAIDVAPDQGERLTETVLAKGWTLG